MTDPAAVAEDPDSAALSVVYQGHQREVAEAFVTAVRQLPEKEGSAYYEKVWAMAPAGVRTQLEEVVLTMTADEKWPVFSPFAKEHFGQGKAEGKAEGEAGAILTVLDARGLQATPEQRARINGCSDLDQLETWLKKAATAKDPGDLFR